MGWKPSKDADTPTRSWHAIDDRGNRSNNTLPLQGRPIQQQYHHYKDGKASAMDVTARSCSLGSEIVDLALHQPIRNVRRTYLVANCEFRQRVHTSLEANKQTIPCHLTDASSEKNIITATLFPWGLVCCCCHVCNAGGFRSNRCMVELQLRAA